MHNHAIENLKDSQRLDREGYDPEIERTKKLAVEWHEENERRPP